MKTIKNNASYHFLSAEISQTTHSLSKWCMPNVSMKHKKSSRADWRRLYFVSSRVNLPNSQLSKKLIPNKTSV